MLGNLNIVIIFAPLQEWNLWCTDLWDSLRRELWLELERVTNWQFLFIYRGVLVRFEDGVWKGSSSYLNLKDARQVKPLVALIVEALTSFSARAQSVISTDAIWTLCEAHFAGQHHSAAVSFRERRGKKKLSFILLWRTGILSTAIYKSCEWSHHSKNGFFLVPPAHFGCVIVHDAQLLFLLMWKMHNYNNYAEGEKKHCNHVIMFPTVCW